MALDTKMPCGVQSRTLEDVYRIPMTAELKKEMMHMAGLGARIAEEHEKIGEARGEARGKLSGTIETCLSLNQTPEATVRLLADQ